MKSFRCPVCSQLLFFENSVCLFCRTGVGLDPVTRELVEVSERYLCAERATTGCNWLVDVEGWRCPACLLTRERTDDPGSLPLLREAEQAKRRMVFQLGELGLPLAAPRSDGGTGPVFDLIRGTPQNPVTIGHADGVVTIDLAESDDVRREKVREQLGEAYRTMLGHMRHEIGHYYWPLIVTGDRLARCRELFGDESEDYGDALQRHYEQGPPPGWEQHYVSSYATMHPWEDWAETWAHYLHLLDTLQTSEAYGLHHPQSLADAMVTDDYVEQVVAQWLPLSYALNQVNRSMGKGDLYPFVLTPTVLAKLKFVDTCIRGS